MLSFKTRAHLALACWPLLWPCVASAQNAPQNLPPTDSDAAPSKTLGVVTVTGKRISSLPSQIPTTIEGIDGTQINATINATDSEDALKYLPSLLVRKRYAGDYNHAVLSTRASGTGNSARSMVYADGILLSNLLGNGATFAPRWGLVTPEEIERVDVLYGPFAAAYPGNSVGAVVDYRTRMPERFEAHAKIAVFSQPFELYQTRDTYTGKQASVSLGSREGAFAWWLNMNRLDSESQPLSFTTSTAPVLGAEPTFDRNGRPWYITGTTTQYRTVQDHLKLKLAYDITPQLRANYVLGWWHNDAEGRSRLYVAPGTDGVANVDKLTHTMHAVSLKSRTSRTQGDFDWEFAASLYDYRRDKGARGAVGGGAGTVTDQRGTGWNTLAWRGTWRPSSQQGAHVVDAGVQQDSYQLRTGVFNVSNWSVANDPTPASRFDGETRLQAVHAQDAWRFAPDWMAVLGLRAEQWRASDGLTQTGANVYAHPSREKTTWSPKAALSRQMDEQWVLKASLGRAVRFPTVSELYQGAATAGGISTIANPDLRPERSWTSELSSEWMWAEDANLRTTLFREETQDALYSQLLPNVAPPSSSVQNVDRVRTLGIEISGAVRNLFTSTVDVQGSLTYADSKILANSGYVAVPGDTLGKWQPRVPRWRATMLASWRANERFSVSYGARYSGVQYSSLDNSDVNGAAYMGSSKYLTTDLRLRYAIDKQWHAALGIDNLNNCKYWNFHPYPQRTYSAELSFNH